MSCFSRRRDETAKVYCYDDESLNIILNKRNMNNLKKIYAIAILICAMSCIGGSCSKEIQTNEEEEEPLSKDTINNNFEVSYWIDIDIRANNSRGYWSNVADRQPDILPTEEHIENACNQLRNQYHGNKLYVTYHRQFEINDVKTVLLYWKNSATKFGMKVVPCIVLENYATPTTMNFTDDEISSFASWCISNVNNSEFGIYDVYSRQSTGSQQDKQLIVIRGKIGNKIVHVGLQPEQKINSNFLSGVQDTWTAECQGLTNQLWEEPVSYKGSTIYGRKLLEKWVKERVSRDSVRIVWDMIPVAWDYDFPVDPLGYICPGDDALKNDPPIAGRIALCHKYIENCYPNGVKNPRFGGYSCDLHILDANSSGKPESPSFYEQLRANKAYTGYFSSAMNQIGALYDKYDSD